MSTTRDSSARNLPKRFCRYLTFDAIRLSLHDSVVFRERTVLTYLARNTLLANIFELAESFGVDRAQIIAAIGLDRSKANQQGALIPSEMLIDATEFAAARSGRRAFGLMLGSRGDHRLLGPLGLLMEQSVSGEEVLSVASRYMHLHNNALRYSHIPQRGREVVRLEVLARGHSEPRHYIEALLAMCTQICRLLLGSKWRPEAVLFEHAPIADRLAYARVFGPSVKFKQSMNALILRSSDFKNAVRTSDPELKHLLDIFIQDLNARYRQDLQGKVSGLIGTLLPSGSMSIERVAALVELTPRTLQRKLKAEGTSFHALLTEVRIAMVDRYLRIDGLTAGEIAPFLGFSELSGVSRFLRTHVGASARQLKKQPQRVAARPARKSARR